MLKVFKQCLDEAGIFSRPVPNKSLVEFDTHADKSGSPWLIIAAGISDEVAERYFRPGSQRARDAIIPLQVSGGGQAEIFLQMRPIEWPTTRPEKARFIAHYAPGEKIPLVEIMEGRISLDFDLPDGDFGLFNLRWEVDAREAAREPKEAWLKDWRKTLGSNPAHPPSHLHFNSQPKISAAERSGGWEEPAENDLQVGHR